MMRVNDNWRASFQDHPSSESKEGGYQESPVSLGVPFFVINLN